MADQTRWSDMTAAEKKAVAAESTRREREAQGLPPLIEDPAFYAYLARHLRAENVA